MIPHVCKCVYFKKLVFLFTFIAPLVQDCTFSRHLEKSNAPKPVDLFTINRLSSKLLNQNHTELYFLSLFCLQSCQFSKAQFLVTIHKAKTKLHKKPVWFDSIQSCIKKQVHESTKHYCQTFLCAKCKLACIFFFLFQNIKIIWHFL